MPLPDITHLQYLILTTLQDGEKPGREIREVLSKEDVESSGPAFYQLMARLEEAELVKGRYDERLVEKQRIKERRYRITAKGKLACKEARSFYLDR